MFQNQMEEDEIYAFSHGIWVTVKTVKAYTNWTFNEALGVSVCFSSF